MESDRANNVDELLARYYGIDSHVHSFHRRRCRLRDSVESIDSIQKKAGLRKKLILLYAETRHCGTGQRVRCEGHVGVEY